MDEVRRYEVYVVFQPELEDDQLETRIDRVTGYLTGIGGEIVEISRRGKRRLAYPINRHTQGIDVIYQANVPGARLDTVERQLNLYEDVIRYLVVRRDDLDKQARAAGAASAAASEARAAAADTLSAQPTPPNETFATEAATTAETPVASATPVAETAVAEETPVATSQPTEIRYVDVSAAGTVSPVGDAEGTPVGTPAEETPASEPTTATASDVPEKTEE
jgi:small subunit ribosomal protein S6